jgi:ankyrin repeat protein
MAKNILEMRPWLAREEDNDGNTPMHLAVIWEKVDMLRVFLEHDRYLGYVVSSKEAGTPLLVTAIGLAGHACTWLHRSDRRSL